MPPTFILARDHLEQAASILQGDDTRSQQLRNIIERTIGLLDDFADRERRAPHNVVEFAPHLNRRRLHSAAGRGA